MHNPDIVSKNPFSQRSQIPSWNDDSIATATGMRTRLVSFPLASLQSEAVSPKVYEASPEGTKASRILLKASRSVVVTPQSVPTGLLHSWRPRRVTVLLKIICPLTSFFFTRAIRLNKTATHRPGRCLRLQKIIDANWVSHKI